MVVVSIPEILRLDDCRMNRNTMRPAPNVAVMAAKPPKPPCWRDFVSHTIMTESEFTDISKIARSSNDSFSSDGVTNKTTGKTKRLRARIHRTRSQFAIEESDLPAETLTMTLAETKPDDIGLCRETSFNERIFQEDNNRKCQTWLQSVEASKPLEDVSCYDLSSLEGEAVSIEIPDDTQTYENADGRNNYKSNDKSVHLKNTHKSSAYEHLAGKVSTTPVIPTTLRQSSSFKEESLLNTG